MNNKGQRSLELLHKHGSTSRVLNLLRVSELHTGELDYEAMPFFKNAKLNKTIFVKHRVRTDEEYLMQRRTRVATKLIFPLINGELNYGGHAVLYNQKNYKTLIAEALGTTVPAIEDDLALLNLIDKLPSFDPFLLREYLSRNGRFPSDVYFEISPSDVIRMRNYAANEISKLVEIAFMDAGSGNVDEIIAKMVDLILSDEADDKLSPLRMALGLDGDSFKEGVFSWRGFIYYKWQMDSAMFELIKVSEQVNKVRLINNRDYQVKDNIGKLSTELKVLLKKVTADCLGIMKLYDKAYSNLVDKANAKAFKKFLIDSPRLFLELGHMMGVVTHIESFWKYKFPNAEKLSMDAKEYEDVLLDFVNSLSYTTSKTYLDESSQAA